MQFGQNLEKTKKKQKKQKVQTHVPSQASPQTLPMGLNSLFFFVFFGFLEVLAKLQKTMEKPKKKQKVQTHVPSQASPQTLPMGLNFFFFFCFLEVLAKLQKTMDKPKKTKSSDLCPQPGLSPDLAHGSELFFCFFHSFLHVFHMKMLSSQYLSKNARFYNLHTCAPQAKLQKKNMENQLHLMTYIMTKIMIIYIYIYHDLFNK